MTHGSLVQIDQEVLYRCLHAPLCGGCSFQEKDYALQLQDKNQEIAALFAPLTQEDCISPILPCENPWQYRNKMEFSFSQNKKGERFLGLILRGSRGYVFNLQECHLVSSWFAEVVKKVFLWWQETGLSAFRRDGTGTLRYLTLREGIFTHNKMVILTVSGNPSFPISRRALDAFVKTVQEVVRDEDVSIFLRVQQALVGIPTQFYEIHLFGKDHLVEKLTIDQYQFTFKISLSSFFQPNSRQAEKLYAAALAMTPHPKKRILDLYAGTATLGIVFSKQAEEVISIELAKEAILDAEENLHWNHISNVKLYAGDVGKLLKLHPEWKSSDLVIVDPPRAGLGKEVVHMLIDLQPQEILYISCNPKTQREDVMFLQEKGYQIIAIQPVDQFPHTPHIENIILLRSNTQDSEHEKTFLNPL